MKHFYIVFGKIHTHRHNKVTFDKDLVGVIRAKDYIEAREIAFRYFGDEFFTVYNKKPDMSYFPRGLANVN